MSQSGGVARANMMHKIRLVMGKRDDNYELNGHIEIDENFFEKPDNKDVRESKKERFVSNIKDSEVKN